MDTNNASEKLLNVYYDGLCPLCSREIDVYRKKDSRGKIRFVDIADPLFDASSEGLDGKKIHEVFHVKDKDSKLFTGVEGFVIIWDTLGIFRPLSVLAKLPVTSSFFHLGYSIFKRIRPMLPKRQCDDGRCRV